MADFRERLEYLRAELRAERISQGELVELQGLAEHIDPGDVELLEAAGVPEFPETKEFDVSVTCLFEAETPEDAVRQFVAWLFENAASASYNVDDLSGAEPIVIDALSVIDPEQVNFL